MKTIEQLTDEWKLEEYKICVKCQQRLVYNDIFIDVTKGVCGISQGHPCTYIKKSQRYHVACYKNG